MQKKLIILWLSLAAFTVIVQILLGGYVRLTKSGLSMYDWHVITGVVPPLTEESWQETFENYKKTPEYRHVNKGMSLDEYKLIYLREYNHRILGRLTGLIFVVPLFIFLGIKAIRFKDSYLLLITGLLYAAQGVMGWYMVKSGLVDQPSVSHYRLAVHLILAFIILVFITWKLADVINEQSGIHREAFKTKTFKALSLFFVLLTLQIVYGAFVAGLKAGHVSDTFPLMFGYLIPPNLVSGATPGVLNLFANSVTVHFIHRWLAFLVLTAGFWVYWEMRKDNTTRILALVLPVILVTQIILGLSVIWLHVPISLALIHQGGAVVVTLVGVLLLHRLVRR